MAELMPLFPILVICQSVGMMKRGDVVAKTWREQRVMLSLRLLKALNSMQSHSRALRKLKSKAASSSQQSAEEVEAEREKAMTVLNQNPQLKEELTSAFKLFDTTDDNNIDSTELKGLLRSMGQNVSDAEAAQLLNEMDADNSGSVSLDEFLTVMASEVDEAAEEDKSVDQLADEIFQMLNEEKDEFITYAEFKHALQKLPTDMHEDDIDELLQEMFGGSGPDVRLDKHEFKEFIEAHKDYLLQ